LSDAGSGPESVADDPGASQAELLGPGGQAEPEQLGAATAEPHDGHAGRRRRRGRWRAPVAVVLIVLGCVLAPVAVIGVWTANQVSDTNRYIANIEPLIHEPAIQNALTDKGHDRDHQQSQRHWVCRPGQCRAG
jgi:hypothetical protein